MYSIYLSYGVAALVTAGVYIRYRRNGRYIYIDRLIWLLRFVLTPFFPGCLIGWGFSACAPMKYEQSGTFQLVSMRSGDATAGAFVLGSGTIEGQLFYTFYVQNSDGSVSPHRVKADPFTSILEDPALANKGYWTFSRTIKDDAWQYANFVLDFAPSQNYRHQFRVPVGTVIRQFSLR